MFHEVDERASSSLPTLAHYFQVPGQESDSKRACLNLVCVSLPGVVVQSVRPNEGWQSESASERQNEIDVAKANGAE